MTANEKQFTEIYNEFKGIVSAVICRHNVCHHDRDDISQQVWMRFWKVLSEDRLDFTKSVPGYLHQIAKNLCYDYFRIKNHTLEGTKTASLSFKITENADLESLIQGEDSEAQIDIVDQAEALLAEVETLPADHAQVILLRLNGVSYSEMLVITNQALGTVKSRIFRGRETLKAESLIYEELRNFNDYRRVTV